MRVWFIFPASIALFMSWLQLGKYVHCMAVFCCCLLAALQCTYFTYIHASI